MARPYADPVEVITVPIPAQPVILADAKIVDEADAPASLIRSLIVPLPGYDIGWANGGIRAPTKSTG